MNMMVKIEKGIPLPGNDPKYPFAKMDVGDSFAISIDGKNTASRVSTYAHYASKRLGMKFVVRTMVEQGEKIIRVWRKA